MKKPYFILFFTCFTLSCFSQVTTSSISGMVTSKEGEPLFSAIIAVKNMSSGTLSGNTARDDGRFNINGLRVGGPYTITVSYVGYNNYVEENVYLTLGKDYRIEAKLSPNTQVLKEFVITSNTVFNSDKTGTGTNIDKKKLENLPTVSRNFEDFTRLTPQANFRNGNLTVAGLGNRFNDLRIDGAYNSDPYGRNPNGQNGGQTGVNPISIDAIEQVQVNLSP